jgi:nicotinamide mononucleotide transporter
VEVPDTPGWLTAAWHAAGGIESVAVALGIAYVLLAIRQHRACWVAGGLSTALYILVFAEARLYLQAALQVLYVVLAVYGWRSWGRGDGLRPVHWPPLLHAAAAIASLLLAAATVPALVAWSDSVAPWSDALGTWASVAATVMMTRKVVGCWPWWLVIDAALALLFWYQGLHATALLYLLFAVVSVEGWREWRQAARDPAAQAA